MDILKKMVIVGNLLHATRQSQAFIQNKPLIMPIRLSAKKNMPDDDELFMRIFNEKNYSPKQATDEKINSFISAMKLENEMKEELFSEDHNAVSKSIINKYPYLRHNYTRNILFNKIKNASLFKDSPITKQDNLIGVLPDNGNGNFLNGIYINENFISHHVYSQGIIDNSKDTNNQSFQEKIIDVFNQAQLKLGLVKTKKYLNFSEGELKMQKGAVLEGIYKNKTIYFLINHTKDDRFRLIDISNSEKNLGKLS